MNIPGDDMGGNHSQCSCEACETWRRRGTYMLVFAIALACGLTVGAWLERFGL